MRHIHLRPKWRNIIVKDNQKIEYIRLKRKIIDSEIFCFDFQIFRCERIHKAVGEMLMTVNN